MNMNQQRIIITQDTVESMFQPATDYLMNHPGALRNIQHPNTYPELLKSMEHEFLLSMFKPEEDTDGDNLDNNRAGTPNNNTDESDEDVARANIRREHEQMIHMEKHLTEELSINVDSEEESGHSWRPSVANTLSPDFFLTKSNSFVQHPHESDQVTLELPSSFDREHERMQEIERSFSFSRGRTSQGQQETGYVQSQKAELNILKYEVLSAKRKITDSRAAIRDLSMRLNEVSKFQNSQEIKKLTNENAQLRLECQCLCMEVDFYLKGQAPLGEVDENFYKEKSSEAQVTQTEPKPSQPESANYAAEELEEGNKWECHQCTFANHPAINSCEMCHVPRLRRGSQQLPPAQCTSQDTCFCHPREHDQSS